MRLRAWLCGFAFISFLAVFSAPLCAQDSKLKAFADSLKKKEFVMKAHEELFGTYSSGWDGRLIQEASVVLDQESISIGGTKGWEGSYFVSEKVYSIRDVKFEKTKNFVQVKVWRLHTGLSLQPEIKINFVGANVFSGGTFERLFFSLFFSPDEDRAKYVRENEAKLLEKYIDTQNELFMLSTESRLAILRTIRRIGFTGRPKLERVGSELYIPAYAVGEVNVYNDLRVSKNQRIASSIEALIPSFRLAAMEIKNLPPLIKGVAFRWTIHHRDFLRDSQYDSTKESMELITPAEALHSLDAGNLSLFEVVQKSILRENGVKITLTSWDPIGAR